MLARLTALKPQSGRLPDLYVLSHMRYQTASALIVARGWEHERVSKNTTEWNVVPISNTSRQIEAA